MAREVIKRVGKRAYRYRVESYREGAKVRSRWTYLGVADEASSLETRDRPLARASVRGGAREALIDAFERLSERQGYSAITAGAISIEAGLAHGTFYRYFKNKRDVLLAALARVREAVDRVRPSFNPPYGDLANERRRVREWTRVLATLPEARGVIRAWFDALDRDAELAAAHAIKVRERTATLAGYLEALAETKTIVRANYAALAIALTTLLDATFRDAIVSGILDEFSLEGVSDVFDRAIFGVLPARSDARS